MPHNLQRARFQIEWPTLLLLMICWELGMDCACPPTLACPRRWEHISEMLSFGFTATSMYCSASAQVFRTCEPRFCQYLILLSEFPNPLYLGSGKTLVQLTNALLSETCEYYLQWKILTYIKCAFGLSIYWFSSRGNITLRFPACCYWTAGTGGGPQTYLETLLMTNSCRSASPGTSPLSL